jgi:HD-GYP domain-containing protein (c-di-GMP phosphodiesterase class II)
LKYMICENAPENFVEALERIEGLENRVSDPKEADILLCSADSPVPENGKFRAIFHKEGRVEVYRKDKKVAEFSIDEESPHSIWAFLKILIDGDKSLVKRNWARKIVSGIIQGMIALMEVEDEEGYSHSQRVAQLAVKFGKYLGLPEDSLEKLREHAMLHDVGKIGIEQLMLYSPTRIRIFENLPKDHTVLGSIYLSTIELLWDVIPTVRHHHERWDGEGYPDGLKGEEIPLFARIVAICNIYDNLTHFVSSEWESSVKTPEEALEIIESESGKSFDPKLVKRFVEMMRKEIKGGQNKNG